MKIPKFNFLIKYHIFLGLLLNIIPQLFIFHLFVFFVYYIINLYESRNNNLNFFYNFLIGFLYFPLCESLGRLHSLDPFVPWELGKYMAIFFILILIISGRIIWGWRSILGFLLILTTLINWNTSWKLVFFNGLTAYCILLLGDTFKSILMNLSKFLFFLRFSTLPLITFLFSSITKLKDFKPESLDLSSQFVLDEIPANQIATYTGLGFFLMIVFFKNKIIFGLNQWQRLVIALGFLVVGILSFSRGGIIVSIIGIIFLYLISIRDIFNFRNIKQIIILIPILLLIVFYLNKISNGNLFLRYQGETQGTLAGSKETGINTLTTNRYNIMIGDLSTFSDNFFIGVETGRSKEYRLESEHQYSHVEFSRLLAEHGLVGVIVILVWLYDLFTFKESILRSIYIIGFLTTFHGATRTAIPLVFMLISTVKLNTSKKFNG